MPANRCPKCSRTFTSRRELNTHQKIHLPKRYECDICQKKFCTKDSIRVHMQSSHSVDSPIHECDICKKRLDLNNEVFRSIFSMLTPILSLSLREQFHDEAKAPASREMRAQTILSIGLPCLRQSLQFGVQFGSASTGAQRRQAAEMHLLCLRQIIQRRTNHEETCEAITRITSAPMPALPQNIAQSECIVAAYQQCPCVYRAQVPFV